MYGTWSWTNLRGKLNDRTQEINTLAVLIYWHFTIIILFYFILI